MFLTSSLRVRADLKERVALKNTGTPRAFASNVVLIGYLVSLTSVSQRVLRIGCSLK